MNDETVSRGGFRSVRGRLILLAAACTVPVLAFSIVLFINFANVEMDQAFQRVEERAQLLADDVDREISRKMTVADVLALSPHLVAGELAAFYPQALAVHQALGTHVMVRDATGRQLLNTRRAWSAPLPSQPFRLDADQRALATGQAQVSGLVRLPIVGDPAILIIVPIWRPDSVQSAPETVFLLTLTLELQRLQGLVAPERWPEGWIAGFADREGMVIARTRNQETLVGTPIAPELWQAIADAPADIHLRRNLDGVDTYQAYARSARSGWLIGVSVPTAQIAAPAWLGLMLLAAGGLLLTFVGLAVALVQARRLTQGMQGLVDAAHALGAGWPVPSSPPAVTEIAAVRDGLDSAAALIEARNDALRQSEQRLRCILDNLFAFVGVLDVDGTLIEVNRAAVDAAGLELEAVRYRKFWDCYWWSYDAGIQAELRLAVEKAARGQTVRYDVDVRMAGGRLMTIDFQLAPLRDQEGRVTHLIPSGIDISDRVRTQGLLHDQIAELETVLEAVPAMVFIAHDPACREVTGSRLAYEILGLPFGANASKTAPEGERPRFKVLQNGVELAGDSLPVQRAAERGEDVRDAELEIMLEDGRRIHILGNAFPLRTGAGTIRGAVGAFIDITERKSAEDRMHLLAREVAHRANNTLSVVTALVRLTRAEDIETYKQILDGRIAALGRAQTLLSQSRWEGADLRRLVEEEMAPFLSTEGRIRIVGPPLSLVPSTAQSIAMAIHELATNAVKYGALSVPEGRITIVWWIESSNQLRLSWTEENGPPVQAPSRTGLGTGVIKGAVSDHLDGDVTFDWLPSGLVCRMILPSAAVGEVQAAA